MKRVFIALCEILFSPVMFRIRTTEKVLYLTFDDGPDRLATKFVLDTLKKYNAKATFFCVGENVEREQELFERLKDEGHRIGNHTHRHLNGWKVSKAKYVQDAEKCRSVTGSSLFRPPYGRISPVQYYAMRKKFKIVMWDVLSGDFRKGISPKQCFSYVVRAASGGSILVFHDSQKSYPVLRELLPELLKHYSRLGFTFRAIPSA